MTKDQIAHMVQRFLGWKLPADFTPDGGITFSATVNEETGQPIALEPTGTNLFTSDQAKEMVEFLVDGLPVQYDSSLSSQLAKVMFNDDARWDVQPKQVQDYWVGAAIRALAFLLPSKSLAISEELAKVKNPSTEALEAVAEQFLASDRSPGALKEALKELAAKRGEKG